MSPKSKKVEAPGSYFMFNYDFGHRNDFIVVVHGAYGEGSEDMAEVEISTEGAELKIELPDEIFRQLMIVGRRYLREEEGDPGLFYHGRFRLHGGDVNGVPAKSVYPKYPM